MTAIWSLQSLCTSATVALQKKFTLQILTKNTPAEIHKLYLNRAPWHYYSRSSTEQEIRHYAKSLWGVKQFIALLSKL